tara:strand:+ start:246 stop:464 length:219 start_codon:yes stop_codon:yes gene_type:complete
MYGSEDAYAKHYGQLVGWKVEQIAVDNSDENEPEGWYGLVFTKGKQKKIAWILCDPEGNGSGFLNIDKVEKR